ncbi:MAG: STAS domain-containing protein [Coprothermobacterota bacterium]|nr:STAS domain-containing protein [Coprothermobacterota bacterium]
MEILRSEQQGWSVVTVKGRLDAVSTTDFEKKVLGWTDEGARKVVLDFSGLDYISSAGLRSILLLAKKMRAVNGSLAVANPSGVVREVFTISSFDTIIPIHDSLSSALGSAD